MRRTAPGGGDCYPETGERHEVWAILDSRQEDIEFTCFASDLNETNERKDEIRPHPTALLIPSLSIILQQPSPTYPPARITALIRWVISLLFPFRRLRRAFAAAGLSACRVGLPSLPLSSRTCRPRQSGRSSCTCPHGPGAKSPLSPVTQTAVGAARPKRQQQLRELSNARVVSAASASPRVTLENIQGAP